MMLSMAMEPLSDQVSRPNLRDRRPKIEIAEGEPRRLGLSIARDGSWSYQGSPIRRPELIRLFATALRRGADGRYWLVTPVEQGLIEVEDVPFVAVELSAEGTGRDQRLRLRSNLDHWVTLGVQHPLHWRRPPDGPEEAGAVPYVEMGEGLEARLARPVYYELVERGTTRLEGHREHFGVWSDGCFFTLDDGT
jgi:hypothetical protein